MFKSNGLCAPSTFSLTITGTSKCGARTSKARGSLLIPATSALISTFLRLWYMQDNSSRSPLHRVPCKTIPLVPIYTAYHARQFLSFPSTPCTMQDNSSRSPLHRVPCKTIPLVPLYTVYHARQFLSFPCTPCIMQDNSSRSPLHRIPCKTIPLVPLYTVYHMHPGCGFISDRNIITYICRNYSKK